MPKATEQKETDGLRRGRRKNFHIVYNMIYDTPVSVFAKVLYGYLSRCADDYGVSFPSRTTIAAKCSISVRTVDSAIKELIDVGLLSKEARYTPCGDRTSNLYTIWEFPGQEKIQGMQDALSALVSGGGVVQEVHHPGAGGALGVVQEVRYPGAGGAHIQIPSVDVPNLCIPSEGENEPAPAPSTIEEVITILQDQPVAGLCHEVADAHVQAVVEPTPEVKPAESITITVEKLAPVDCVDTQPYFRLDKPAGIAPAQSVTLTFEKSASDARGNAHPVGRPDKPAVTATAQRVYRDVEKLPVVNIGLRTDVQPAEKVYGSFQRVRLSDEGHDALVGKYGDEKIRDYIDRIDLYIEGNGKDFANHQAVIEKWIKEDARKNPDAKPAARMGKPANVNRFVNFKQRNWDYAALEKLEREYVLKELEKDGIKLGV